MDQQVLYQELRLPSSTQEAGPSFRLLRLNPSSGSLNSDLQVFSLAKCPKYKALSYCWGDESNPLSLRCNGFDLPVTRNLHAALEHLSGEYANQWLWIDAICIDQSDEARTEREHQVSIMRDIYSNADEVLVWLGPSRSSTSDPSTYLRNARLACSACKEYASLVDMYIRCLAKISKIDLHNTSETDPNKIIETDLHQIGQHAIDLALRDRPFTPAESEALLDMLRQPYWSRVWIIQELCVAKGARIYTGMNSITWDDFKWSLSMMERCMGHVYRSLGPNLRALMELRRLYHEEDSDSSRQLADLLSQFRWSQATKGVDKIYSLLGLVPETDRNLIKIDYKETPSECYTRVTFALLKHHRDLNLLINCNTPRFVRSQLNSPLPSWVLDWSYDASHIPIARSGIWERNFYHSRTAITKDIYQKYQASGNSECPAPTLRLRPEGAILTLQGMVTTCIAQVAPPIELHHQLLALDVKGIHTPISPLSWNQFIAHHGVKFAWRALSSPGVAKFLIVPWNYYRKGAALDVLLQSSRLSQIPKTRLGNESDSLRVFFLTMMKGIQDYEYVQHRITDAYGSDPIEEMTSEFRDFQSSLRWNPIITLMVLLGIKSMLPSVYYFFLGLSYEHHRGAFHLRGPGIALLQLITVLYPDYVPIPFFLLTLLQIYGFYYSFILSLTASLAKAKLIDMVPTRVLDYRVARTESGHLALVVHGAEIGDKIALLKGGKCPFVVRPAGSQWKLVGDSYVHGIMGGEAWDDRKTKSMEFI